MQGIILDLNALVGVTAGAGARLASWHSSDPVAQLLFAPSAVDAVNAPLVAVGESGQRCVRYDAITQSIAANGQHHPIACTVAVLLDGPFENGANRELVCGGGDINAESPYGMVMQGREAIGGAWSNGVQNLVFDPTADPSARTLSWGDRLFVQRCELLGPNLVHTIYLDEQRIATLVTAGNGALDYVAAAPTVGKKSFSALLSDYRRVMVFDHALSPAELIELRTLLLAPKRPGTRIIFSGNSMTDGYIVAARAYPDAVMAALPAGTAHQVNLGVASNTGALLDTYALVREVPRIISRDTVVVYWEARNDLLTGATQAQAIQHTVSFVAKVRSAWPTVPIVVVAAPPTAGGGPTYEADRIGYNVFFRGYSSVLFADLETDPRVGAFGANLNVAFWNVDGIHPNAAGSGLVAAVVAPVVRAARMRIL